VHGHGATKVALNYDPVSPMHVVGMDSRPRPLFGPSGQHQVIKDIPVAIVPFAGSNNADFIGMLVFFAGGPRRVNRSHNTA
jgi:hypothetical protein